MTHSFGAIELQLLRLVWHLKRITQLFHVVPNIDKGILAIDALSHLDVTIDTQSGRLSVDGREVHDSA